MQIKLKGFCLRNNNNNKNLNNYKNILIYFSLCNAVKLIVVKRFDVGNSY